MRILPERKHERDFTPDHPGITRELSGNNTRKGLIHAYVKLAPMAMPVHMPLYTY